MILVTTTATNPVPIARLDVSAYTIPTDAPESDGTLAWDSTTMVLVAAHAGGCTGAGYTYAGPAAATVVNSKLAGVVTGQDALTPTASWAAIQHAVRNLGKPGVAAQAISAVDIALWDLQARLLNVPLVVTIGAVHEATPIYGSGGFTSYDNDALAAQLAGWVQAGIPRVKMKVGRVPMPTRNGCARHAKLSGTPRSCSWTRTAPSSAKTRCCGRSGSANTGCAGSKNR